MTDYNPQGSSNWFWVDNIADPDAPTVAELTAGTMLGCHILEPTLPAATSNPITYAPLCATKERSLPGVASVTPAALVLARSAEKGTEGDLIEDEMLDAIGDTGFLVHVLKGSNGPDALPDEGDKIDVWPATIDNVAAVNGAGGAPGSWRIDFTHPGDLIQGTAIAGA